jgi:23S rRNA maturation mini-RNase III
LNRDQLHADAWVGDAVLALYLRQFILRESGAVDGARASRLAANRFLNSLGQPTEVEARIGRVYLTAGLDAAFAWMEENLAPVIRRTEEREGRSGPAIRKV